MAKAQAYDADEGWTHVDWVECPDGDNRRGTAQLKEKYPEVALDPENWRFDTICDRSSGASSIRLMRRTVPQVRQPRRKPRTPK